MKFTLSWLKDHLETQATLDEILYALTDLGLEVEGVEDPSQKLAAFTVGEVLEAEQHPDADRLRVCQVRTADGDKQIICGAPNARAGIKVVIAKPGDYIPGIDTTIAVGKIRGVESHGMMLSEREMEISDEHSGIVELAADAPVGARYVDYVGGADPVIEIAITPNRPDALGVRGIARDLAARGIGTMRELPPVQPLDGETSPVSITLDDSVADRACPLFLGVLVRGVKNGPSPEWMQKRLRAIGLRPISTLVDITNYFTVDLNRPLHVFDADKLRGNLVVRTAKPGETLVGLDEKEYTFGPGQVVISDDTGIESIGGIMGGLATGCTEETANVFLEAAVWDHIQIATTGRALKINSDARYRNERGIDPAFNHEALDLATQMILDLCGGVPSNRVVAGKVPDTARAYRLDPARVRSLVGMDIPESDQRQTLTALGFRLEGNMAHVPSWRPDILGEADLVEEVARIASLTRLQGRPMARVQPGVPKPILSPMQKRAQMARRSAAALGYNECVTYSFIDHEAAALFGAMDTVDADNADKTRGYIVVSR